ncbi:MAG: adenine phosphoribosyltransferase [Spirochaetota bacterium]
MDISTLIRDVPDYPKPGIIFKDITPLWKDKTGFAQSIRDLAGKFKNDRIDVVAGAEARGFLVGAPVAYELGVGFVPVRKPKKLPYKHISVSYELEYGTDTIAIHADAVAKGQRVLIIDDLIATGGTVAAMTELVEKLGGVVAGIGFIIELGFLKGREKISRYRIESLITY